MAQNQKDLELMAMEEEEAELLRLEEEELLELEQQELAALEAEDSFESQLKPGEAPQFIEERAPRDQVSFADRLLYKNILSDTDPKATLDYFKKKKPDLDWTYSPEGELAVRGKGEKEFRYADAPGLDLEDITDIGYDLISGGAQTLAGAGGLAAGGPAGGYAAGTATGGGLELIRQGIAKGITGGDISAGQVGLATATGGLSPLLFGFGMTGKQAAKLGATRGLSKEAVKNLQSGIVPRIAKSAAAKAGETVSGVKATALRTYAARKPEVDALIASGPTDLTDKISTQTMKAIEDARANAGRALEAEVKKSNAQIDTLKIFEPLRKKWEEATAKAQQLGSKDLKKQASDLKKQYRNAVQGMPAVTTPDQAFYLQKFYRDKARFGVNIDSLPFDERDSVQAARDVYKTINKELQSSTGISNELKSQVKKLIKLEKTADKYLGTGEKTLRSLGALDAPSYAYRRKLVKDIKEVTGLDLKDASDLLVTYKEFAEPAGLPKSSQGVTSTTRALGLNLFPGAALIPAAWSPAAMKLYTGAGGAAVRGAQKPLEAAIKAIPEKAVSKKQKAALRKTPYYLANQEILKMLFGTDQIDEGEE